ncbi:MAG: pentapeptide repeat-containing protein, partial [Phormidesmis sp.]
LQDRRVRLLLSTKEKGYKQDLTDANLRGTNLTGVTLEGATLRRAILSDALLTNAILKDATLTEAQAVNADFTGACLTGATLEAWNIDSSTTLKNIDCEYVFLRETPDAKGSRERRPHNPDKVFQPGDFEKFFKEMLDEVQILIRNGIDPIAFRAAFQQIMEQNSDITHDAIKSVEKQGEDMLVTLQVPEGTDKGKVERDWDSGYQLGLKEGRTTALLESAPKFEKLAFLLAEKDITTIQRTEVMTGNDQGQRIHIRGSVNQSAVILGDHNTVTNQINQLGDSQTQAQLKDLLLQLTAAIEAELTLAEDEKADALAEVSELAAAGQAPNDGSMKKTAKRSLNVLKGITLGIGETTKLATTAKGLLEAIALLFSL